MDPARFDAAYARGAALSVDELVVFALDAVERMLAERDADATNESSN